MNPIEQFAREAQAFLEWAEAGTDEGLPAAETALRLITALFHTGLLLPKDYHQLDLQDAQHRQTGSGDLVYERCSRLPFQYYSEVFNSFETDEPPVTGNLHDDIRDIYIDLLEGMKLYDTGKADDAAWQWRFLLGIHWGEHATSAIRALYWHIRENEGFGDDA